MRSEAFGARGWDFGAGGWGGEADATYAVTPGTVFQIVVGGPGDLSQAG